MVSQAKKNGSKVKTLYKQMSINNIYVIDIFLQIRHICCVKKIQLQNWSFRVNDFVFNVKLVMTQNCTVLLENISINII